MSPAGVLAAAAALLCAAAAREVIADRDPDPGRLLSRSLARISGGRIRSLAAAAIRLGVSERLARAGLSERFTLAQVMVAKVAAACSGALLAPLAAPAAPGRLSLLVALSLPAAGFVAPDAALERRARLRARRIAAALPDALDLLAVGAASGRSPVQGFAEVGAGDGPLARELAATVAEITSGVPQREALAALRRRAPESEIAALTAAMERSRRHGSPLADHLRRQAGALRVAERRRIEERAARAAPKIQLAVALLLVPSVLMLIAAALIANSDRLLAGF